MEPSNKAKSPLLYIILIICLLNAFCTLYLISKTRTAGASSQDTMVVPLPQSLNSKAERMALFESIKTRYNDEDYEGLYSMFDEVARVQLSKEQVQETLEDIYNFTGKIKGGAYGSYEGQSSPKGVSSFILYYPINTDKGTGTLKVQLFTQGDEKHRISGFRINKD